MSSISNLPQPKGESSAIKSAKPLNRQTIPVLAQSAAQNVSNQVSPLAKLIGSASAGVIEVGVFHPLDTTAKRLMNHKGKVVDFKQSKAQNLSSLQHVVFREAANKPLSVKAASMFPGLSFAVTYKISQRVYKYGGQPIVKGWLGDHWNPVLQQHLSPAHSKTLVSACAGSLVGMGEVALLPLDILKIKAQTNPDALKGKGILEIVKKDGKKLYNGAGITAGRNACGSFALFGANSWVLHGLFGLKNDRDASFLQFCGASVLGSFASLVVSNPADVIKTRMQSQSFDQNPTVTRVVNDIMKNESMGAFFKGLGPKLLTVGPKLAASFTIAQWLIQYVDRQLK